MRKIYEPNQINEWVEKGTIQNYFSTPNLSFLLYQYEKGEQITSPDKRLGEILFILEGTIRVYGLRDNGTISPVNQESAPIIIGDIEFAQQGNPSFFTEAVTDVTCIALPIRPYKQELDKDIRFLHVLLQSYAKKLQLFAFVDVPAQTIKERILLYLKYMNPAHELRGIEAAVLQLRCSRRQLQRALRSLCEEGKIKKIGKGGYQLSEFYDSKSL